jgi:hypothetical protein
MLLSQIRPLVKSYGQDKAVVLNSGGVRKEYFPYGDALMWESYIFGGAERRHDWNRIKRAAEEFKSYIESGRALLALSYVGGETPKQRKDNAFYAYACARLSGFLWARFSTFDKVRIGMPIGDIQEQAGVYYRMHSKGLVAVNPESTDKHVQFLLGADYSSLLDLYSNETLQVRNGLLSVYVPANSGRVYSDI